MATRETQRLLRPAEVCGLLAISRTTFWRLVKNEELPAVRIRGQVRVDPRELRAYIYGKENQ
jgi:excisionase family DNA binding protein